MTRLQPNPIVVAAVLALGVAAGLANPASGQNWVGNTSSDWNTPSNWDSDTVPNSPTANVVFGNYYPFYNPNISSSVQAQSLTFLSGGFSLFSSSGQSLETSAIILASGVTSQVQFNLANLSTGSLLFPAAGNLVISNNSTGGGSLGIESGTVIGTLGNYGIVVNGPGTTFFGCSFASVGPPNHMIAGGLVKNGPGTLYLSGDGSNLAGGDNLGSGPVPVLTLNGGTIVLDYSLNNNSKFANGGLTLMGGELQFYENNSQQIIQTVTGGTVVAAGHTDIGGIPPLFGGVNNIQLHAGNLTRSTGATADFANYAINGAVVTTTASEPNTNGLLGTGPAFATFGVGQTWAFATNNGDGTIVGLPNNEYGTNVYTSGTNTDVTTSASPSGITTNSLRFNTGSLTLSLTGINTIQSGGILVTPSTTGLTTITGGTLTASNSGELIFHVYNNFGLTINSALVSNVGLTLTGDAYVSLGGTNTGLTGPINVNRGNIVLTAPAAVNSSSQINFNDNRLNVVQALTASFGTNTNGTIVPPIRLAATGSSGTLFQVGTAGSFATLAGVISSIPGSTTPVTISDASGTNSGGINLTNTNTFTGNITLLGGSLGIASDANLGNSANELLLQVNNSASGGLVFLNGGVNVVHTVIAESPTRVVCNGTDSNTISGPLYGGSIIKAGTGTLTLTAAAFRNYFGSITVSAGTLALPGSSSSFPGLITVAAGTLIAASDSDVPSNLTVGGLGTLAYTATTTSTRSFALAGGTLAVIAGRTLTLNGSLVTNAYLNGPGLFATDPTHGGQFGNITTRPSVTLNSNSGADNFFEFTNGGVLNVAANIPVATPVALSGFTNQGSGSVTVGAGSAVNASDFQTYGTLNLAPNTTSAPTIMTNSGTSPLYFNGGSRTFIGTPATADPSGQNVVDYIDLHGQNAVVAGGLFVNNGGVYDTVGAGTDTIVADYGALVKGAGFYQNAVRTQNGGKFQTGNSPGSATFGNFVFGPGGVNNYVFAIDDADGTAGPSPNASGLVSGWGLIKAVQVSLGTGTTPGSFTWTATPSNPLTVAIDTLVNPTMVGTDVAGPMADFDPNQSYSWTAARWSGAYSGPTDAAMLDADTSFDTSGIVNPIAGTFGWSLDPADQTLSLVYTPSSVPESGTLTLVGVAAAGLTGWRRRGRAISRPHSGSA